MADTVARLYGGSRDGESTHVAEGVTWILAAAEAPGLLDVYEADGGVDDDGALRFSHAGQESAEGVAPEALHLPDLR